MTNRSRAPWPGWADLNGAAMALSTGPAAPGGRRTYRPPANSAASGAKRAPNGAYGAVGRRRQGDTAGPYHCVVRVHAYDRPHRDDGVPRVDVAKRQLRGASLKAARRVDWVVRPGRYPRPALSTGAEFVHLIYERRIALLRDDPGANEVLERGKLVNVALAAPALDGLVLVPGRTFSFWRAVGRPSLALGYRYGMEIRGGCVVPSLGGGLCLLTNALFRVAADLGWDIKERHGHTMEAIPSSDEPWGVDATAAWPYIDLRFAVPADASPARLGVQIDGDALVVEVRSTSDSTVRVELSGVDNRIWVDDGARFRSNRVVRRSVEIGGREKLETIATNVKRLVATEDLARSCLTCDLTGCAGRVNIR